MTAFVISACRNSGMHPLRQIAFQQKRQGILRCAQELNSERSDSALPPDAKDRSPGNVPGSSPVLQFELTQCRTVCVRLCFFAAGVSVFVCVGLWRTCLCCSTAAYGSRTSISELILIGA